MVVYNGLRGVDGDKSQTVSARASAIRNAIFTDVIESAASLTGATILPLSSGRLSRCLLCDQTSWDLRDIEHKRITLRYFKSGVFGFRSRPLIAAKYR